MILNIRYCLTNTLYYIASKFFYFTKFGSCICRIICFFNSNWLIISKQIETGIIKLSILSKQIKLIQRIKSVFINIIQSSLFIGCSNTLNQKLFINIIYIIDGFFLLPFGIIRHLIFEKMLKFHRTHRNIRISNSDIESAICRIRSIIAFGAKHQNILLINYRGINFKLRRKRFKIISYFLGKLGNDFLANITACYYSIIINPKINYTLVCFI